MRRLLLAQLVLMVATVGVRAEEPLATKIHNAIQSAEPRWRCVNGVRNAPLIVPSERLVVESRCDYTSPSGARNDVGTYVFCVDSLTDARMSLRPLRDAKVATGWKTRKLKLGDEGYSATYRNGERFEIHFRKGTVVVNLSSNSFQDAERFAHFTLAQL